ncbi:MAG: alpha-hydroxy-acid oxidizing protein [Pseudonocardiales bacterium]
MSSSPSRRPRAVGVTHIPVASSVLLPSGRPVLWGLAVDGAAGVTWVLETLRAELDRALALCGCDSIRELTPDLVRWHGGRTC